MRGFAMRRARAVVAIASALMFVAWAVPAEAATASLSVCLESNSYTFSPGLTLLNSAGPSTQTFNAACNGVSVTAGTGGVTVVPTSGGGAGTVPFTYSGTCLLATMSNPIFNGFIIGGVVTVFTAGPPTFGEYLRVGAIVPNTPCGETRASGLEVSIHD